MTVIRTTLPLDLVPLARVVVLSRRHLARPTSVAPAPRGSARSSGFTGSVISLNVSMSMCGLTKPNVTGQPLLLQVVLRPSLVRLVEVGVLPEMGLPVVAVVVRRRGARKALVAQDRGRVDPRVRVAPKALGVLVARPVPVRLTARGGSGRGRVPALLVARVSTVHRVKPRRVIPRVGSPNLSLPVAVRAVRRIVLSIPPTVPVCALPSVMENLASSVIHASSVTAPLLRRNVLVVRSPLSGPRARRSDR